jgi:hypothetical protein
VTTVLWVAFQAYLGGFDFYAVAVPFFIGGSISKFALTVYESRLHRRHRALTHPPLPLAIAREAARPEDEVELIEPGPQITPPPQPEPVQPGAPPRLLR